MVVLRVKDSQEGDEGEETLDLEPKAVRVVEEVVEGVAAQEEKANFVNY